MVLRRLGKAFVKGHPTRLTPEGDSAILVQAIPTVNITTDFPVSESGDVSALNSVESLGIRIPKEFILVGGQLVAIDYLALSFLPLQMPQATYLAKGSTADVWKVSPTPDNGYVYVSKALRVSANELGHSSSENYATIYGIMNGLSFLHSSRPAIIHGSLNPGKIFVDENHKVKIGEFGLAALCYQVAPYLQSVTFAGFSRWMSPELLNINPDSDDDARPTRESDIWALACTMYEIAMEEVPYSKYRHDIRIQRAIIDGELPGDPNAPPCGEEIPGINVVLGLCWSVEPAKRPTANDLLTLDERDVLE
ncbi:unnamed protein product [Rhizoctonia solani]|uniref:Protein kinase domain-containing protein n=1 Tax=Rhizoctonia solani TaxID=456999 RepID=A0A8H2WGP3_9AGAM|nr:unnamed protein product [Rhizoctonia solani]